MLAPPVSAGAGCDVTAAPAFCPALCLGVGGPLPRPGRDMFEAKARAVEKKESSTETGRGLVVQCAAVACTRRNADAAVSSVKYLYLVCKLAPPMSRSPEVQYALSLGLML